MNTQYQTPQVPGNPCRKPKPIAPRLSPGELARTLADLVLMGFLETKKDGFGITRYKPTARRIQPTVETHNVKEVEAIA